ncbi:putative nucleic-acid-binding protein [Neorhizobium galegae]|uniref:type II toxin-antitoxin system VapC family toxin n=1 Tax=Neorhizobium galegae TaxID=399 RepID=UPI001AEAA542|nr:type II toxin-antitoxin system VapC family toxin [Neorhizobium galegae]MBP2548932.1 putative nucleic-acid-binding protein [Neorhizobium galegae]
MKITADTNLLVRIVVADDPAQAKAAVELLASAELVAITLQSFCELAWVLSRAYNVPRPSIVAAIRAFLETENVIANLPAVEAGLAFLQTGGDFADGVIVHEGRWLGGETFASFYRDAVSLSKAQGQDAILLS